MKKDRIGSAGFRLKAGLRTFTFWIWLIRVIGVIVPRRLRANWRREWEAELRHREDMLADWWSMFAPRSNNNETMSTCPPSAALVRGVPSPARFGSAPRS